MESLDVDSLGALSADELRGLIIRPAAELSALRVTVSGLEGRIGGLEDENTTLRERTAALTTENRTPKDEVARLKELPRRPPDRPSGMEQSIEAAQIAKKRSRSRRRRGATLARIAITQEVVLRRRRLRDVGSPGGLEINRLRAERFYDLQTNIDKSDQSDEIVVGVSDVVLCAIANSIYRGNLPMNFIFVKRSMPKGKMHRVLFVCGNGHVIQEHPELVESVGESADLIASMVWPSHAVVAKAVDLDGIVVYEICKSAMR